MKIKLNFAKISKIRPTFLVVAFFISATSANSQAQTGFLKSSNRGADALLEKHSALAPELVKNSYRRPLFFESAETANTVNSAVFAVLDAPFSIVETTFKSPALWCEVLILHLNTKNCQASENAGKPDFLAVNIGKKTPQALPETFLIEFSHRVIALNDSYLAVELHADKGPLGTIDYQLQLFAIPLPEGKTFINLRYSYGYGLTSRLAMQTYLSTLGRGKVGFSKISQQPSSKFVGGMRGAVERNTMRYYLAMEAYLASLKYVPAQQAGMRMQYWFDATEDYPLQLHEIDRSSYLAMKKDEYRHQKSKSAVVE